MTKTSGKRTKPASDPGVSGEDDDTTSSDGSVRSSPARYDDTCSVELLDREVRSTEKSGSFPVMFADLFKKDETSTRNGCCHFIQPTEGDILEIMDTDIDKVTNLWGHCLLGCFAGGFP